MVTPQDPGVTGKEVRMSDQPRVLLSVEQAAERLSIGRTTVYRLIKTGELQSVRVGRLRRIPADALDDYAAILSDRS